MTDHDKQGPDERDPAPAISTFTVSEMNGPFELRDGEWVPVDEVVAGPFTVRRRVPVEPRKA